MKLTALFAITMIALTAQARSHADFPHCHDFAGDTSLFSIDQLPAADSNAVDSLIRRSAMSQGVNDGDLTVLATISRGQFDYQSPELRHSRSLSDEALMELSHRQLCDLDSTGPCAVYDKGKNLVVIGTRRIGGTTRIFGSKDLMNYGVGVNTNEALVRRIKEKSRDKHAIFTRVYQGECDTFHGADREGATGYRRDDDGYQQAGSKHRGLF